MLQYQLQRMQVFASTFAYGGNKENKRAEDLWPLYFDRYKQYADSEPISEEEKNKIQDEIDALNAQADSRED